MIYITGDTHGEFDRIVQFCETMQTSREDIMIILGDAGFNYYGGWRDEHKKKRISRLPITIFSIHGNHEMRPAALPSYKEQQWHGGSVYAEEAYPNLLFAKDGEVYDLAGKQTLVIGGAYSVDKQYRLSRGWGWWPDEQPSQEIKARVEQRLEEIGWQVDVVLTHTTPLRYEPREVFLPFIDQSTVDKSTEAWLGGIEARLFYDRWYCGHYHVTKAIDKVIFMFEDIREWNERNEENGYAVCSDAE